MPEPGPQISLEDFRRLTPINGLREDNLKQLYRRVETLRAAPGTSLFEIGSKDDASYFLIKGDLDLVDQSGRAMRNLSGGTPESMHRLAHQIPRKVRALCRSEVDYIVVDSSLMDVMLTWDQTDSFELDELEDESADAGDWMTRLLQMKVFQKVPPANLQAMFLRMEQIPVRARDVVIRQDDEGDYFYVLISGRALVTREAPTSPKPIRLAELAPGSCFGEEALISQDRRNATVTMIEDGALMRLAKDDFRTLLNAPLTNVVALDDAQQAVDAGSAAWLDVRLPSEYNNAHLPDALNIPLFMLRMKLSMLDKNKAYIVYCNGGRRSAVASFVLTQKGFESKILDGGIPEPAADAPPE